MEQARLEGLIGAIRTQVPRPVASGTLRARVAPQPRKNPIWLTAGGSLALGLALGVALMWPRRTDDALVASLVDGHVRSLMASHLFDVASTDRHTVKPWFLGKIDFAPAVPDLARDGFPLIGGRLDYLGGRPAAGLVYRRNAHIINVFALPHSPATPPPSSVRGFHLAMWRLGDVDYWAVSDVEASELATFAKRFEASAR
ncbi:putative transmembrane anti-sigma factor [Fimbriimonas ginsengisoli Gsoil 348]|uniref:Putative transmembrane anti-sigma factor n=2 Tax=Fimbriimonas ginsengisoli TaxID=1005039 RepID=A0A068NND1_FIMGI|nr:putative transmembrane anti-sigma factor [Fimbriimonas ginsengisoli Gsoil 348]